MKLELETNTPSFPFIDNDFTGDIASENGSAEIKPLLEKGIKAAQEGNRAEAKQMLLRVTEVEPDNENAWLWLASISEYPEELLGFLHNVLSVNPNNERALEWAKSTKSLLADNFVQRGIDASKESQKEFARQSFLQAVAHDEENETAWLWLASVSDSVEEKNTHLRKVLNLNPENENALLMLKSVKNQNIESLLTKAITEAVANKRGAANEALEKVLKDAPGLEDAWILKSYLADSFNEKIACYEKILEINPESPLANVSWTSLLEMMARAESVEIVENEEKFLADEDESEAEEKFDSDFSDEVLDIEQKSEEDDFTEKDDSSELPTQRLEFLSDLPDGESFLEKAERQFNAVKIEENLEDDFDAQTELTDEPPAETNFYLPEDDGNSDLLLEYQAEDDEENFTEIKLEGEEFENPEPLEISEAFPNYSSNASEKDAEVSEPENNSISYYETDEDVFTLAAPAETDYSQNFNEAEQDYFEEVKPLAEEKFYAAEEEMQEKPIQEVQENSRENVCKTSSEMVACPFCKAENEPQEFVCNSCRTMLTLSDLEMLLAHTEADKETLRQTIERMEDESERRDFDAEELRLLGIGHLNLKNLRLGFAYLQDAVKLNPNNVVLSSQVNALAIRLSEIEQQESIHNSMPKNRKILVVDDSATVRKLISGKLEKSGHEVLCAIDGIEALEKINEVVPDLILLDINMPRMDGYQVCKLIRSNEATKDVPVVMISGKDGFFDKVRGRMAGTTGYITKPFGPETLMKTVETYIV
ncbi:MAG: response regulator [Pyrinomonadaceae bacterium]